MTSRFFWSVGWYIVGVGVVVVVAHRQEMGDIQSLSKI